MLLTDTASGGRSGGRADDPTTAPGRLGQALRRAWQLPLLAHVAALVVGLALLVPLARPTVPTPDEGAYAIQAELVASGRWDYPPPLAHLDPEGRWFPIAHSEAIDGRWFPYVKHPLVPAALAPLMERFGRDAGLALFTLTGTIAAAIVAWFLAAQLDPRRSRLSFWLVAASPLLVDAYIAGAHTWAAALAGAAAFVALRIERRGATPLALAALSVALAGGALMRSEAVLWAGAVLATTFAVRWRRVGPRRATAELAGPTAAVAVTLWLERRWVAAIVHGGAPKNLVVRTEPDGPGGVAAYLADRLNGIWHSTLEGTATGALSIRVLIPAGLLVVTVLVLRGRRSAGREVHLAVAGLVTLVALLALAYPTTLVRGFAAATPVIVIGVALALATPSRLGRDAILLAPVALFTLGLYATQYPDGGAFQWGGRFFTPVIVPLAVVAAGGLRALLAGRPAGERRPLAIVLVALALVMSLGGIRSLGTMRSLESELYAQIAASASPVNVTTSELLPRTMWRDDLPWLHAPPDELDHLLGDLREAGVDRVTVVAPPSAFDAGREGWTEREDRGQVGATALHITVLRR